MSERFSFPLVDRYIGARFGGALLAHGTGSVQIVESQRRLRKHPGFGFIHAFWWIWLEDGRSIASVPPGTSQKVWSLLSSVRSSEDIFDPNLAERLKAALNDSRQETALEPVDRRRINVLLACNESLFRRRQRGECCRLKGQSVQIAESKRFEIPRISNKGELITIFFR